MPPPFLTRFYIYQKERFPLVVHLPLIAAFSFSAIGYSRACRGVQQFIAWNDYAACVFTNLTLFFMLRVSDEHKDKEDDALYRTYLPVVRGVISLKELRRLALILLMAATAINATFYKSLFVLFTIMMLYLLLMRYEFFIGGWLKKHQVWYIVSHMAIIPLADVYASSYDWKLEGSTAPAGLLFFFGVSYLNGMVLEIGRKIRTRDTEEKGVLSYTKLWGLRTAPAAWIIILAANFLLAWTAIRYASHQEYSFMILIALFAACVVPAVLFIIRPAKSSSKWMEIMSLIWALGMYLTLGGIPLLLQLIS